MNSVPHVLNKIFVSLRVAWQSVCAACRHLTEPLRTAESLAERERQTKLMMVSGVALFGVAVMILLLFVLPAVQMTGTPSEAQPPPGGEMPGGEAMPPAGGPPMGDPGMPGGPEGMPGGPPGAPGAGPPGEAAAAPAAPAVVQPPLERSRPNPFAPVGVTTKAPVSAVKEFKTAKTKYGPVWSQVPVTLRAGFLRPERPAHPPPGPSPSEIGEIVAETRAKIRVSSILWSEGSPLATYETTAGETGTVGPGDMIDNYRVTEIGRTHMTIQDTRTNVTERLPLRTE
ncbi:MAG: hypothetical protein GX100_03005 [candidate division WS1 bacterium]|jgi:hypothetical protein|nr:hypothetical protein [candidate division WS1 bacterium]